MSQQRAMVAGRYLLALAGSLGLLAVGAGAFGAHGLKGMVSERMLAAFNTGARYHLVHAVAILAIALARRSGWLGGAVSAVLFTVGIVLFSGSLYAMALTGVTKLGMITPLGGLSLMAGWLALVVAAWRDGRPRQEN
jgi:uncharacterized membrane protein YgdD (TMEM256/DUF423 family)